MNHPENWSRSQVDEFYHWVDAAFRDQLADDPPNLEADLARRGVRPEDAEEMANLLKWLKVLPYADQKMGRNILIFYYTEFRHITRRLANDTKGRQLCALFPVLARMVFQGASVFPKRSAELAMALRHCLRNYPTGADAFVALAELFTDPATGGFRHGYNAEELPREQLNTLIKSEHLHRAGSFQELYRTPEKYEGYQKRLIKNAEYCSDWKILKRRFHRELRSGKIVLRTDARESGRQRNGRDADSPDAGFQDTFDCFCWKWFLDGMVGDEPLVTKLSFSVTPLGTTVFIPGYWSFDPSRDLDWKKLQSFHTSRGVARQGRAFEPHRRRREELERIFLEAEQLSKILKENGAALVERCIRMAGLKADTDTSYVYRVLRKARQGRRRVPSPAQQDQLPGMEATQQVTPPAASHTKSAKATAPDQSRRPKRKTPKSKSVVKILPVGRMHEKRSHVSAESLPKRLRR